MIIGHYATALLPHSRHRQIPLWVFLLCSNLSDFLWFGLALVGLETPQPHSLLEATFQNMEVDMLYSHDLAPVLILSVGVGLGVYFVYKQLVPALWCGGLILLHELADLLVGFQHHLWGKETFPVGLNLYRQSPYFALILEAVFATFFVFLYFRSESSEQRIHSFRYRLGLYLLFIIGSLIWLPTATHPLGKILDLVRL